MLVARALVVLLFVACSGTAALGQGRTDVVTLANGDRITGEIVSLQRGRLEFKTDDAGTIYFEWDKIVRIQAMRQFEVSTSDGRRFLGSLGETGDRSVAVAEGDQTVTLQMAEVTLIVPIGASFWSRLDGSIDAGFTYTRSSEVAQFSFNSDTVFRRPSFLFRLTASATLTDRGDDSERDDRAATEFSYVNYRGRRWFVSGTARFETNKSLGLELRSQVGGLIGQSLVNTNRALFEVGGGLVVNEERGVDTEPTQNIEALFVASSSFYAYDRPKTNFDASIQYYPNLSNWGRQRLQMDVGLKRELLKDLIISLDVYDTFDSEPPNPDAARNDVGVVTSIGWSY